MYCKVALACVLANNDMHHIHLHAAGKQFDRIHGIAQEYYDKLGEESDYLCELTLEKGESLPNLTQSYNSYIELGGDWYIQGITEYDYSITISSISVIITQYLEELDSLRSATDDSSVQSKLDDMIRYWKKELNYKIAKRSSESSNSVKESVQLDDLPTNVQYTTPEFVGKETPDEDLDDLNKVNQGPESIIPVSSTKVLKFDLEEPTNKPEDISDDKFTLSESI